MEGHSGTIIFFFLMYLGETLLCNFFFPKNRLCFASGECCQDWVKRLSQTLNLPRKPEDVFSLAFCAWTQDCDEVQAVKSLKTVTIFPWWRKISNSEDMPLTGENLFRFEVNIL